MAGWRWGDKSVWIWYCWYRSYLCWMVMEGAIFWSWDTTMDISKMTDLRPVIGQMTSVFSSYCMIQNNHSYLFMGSVFNKTFFPHFLLPSWWATSNKIVWFVRYSWFYGLRTISKVSKRSRNQKLNFVFDSITLCLFVFFIELWRLTDKQVLFFEISNFSIKPEVITLLFKYYQS